MALNPSSGWGYYKQINISDSANVSADYQMKLTIYAGTGTDDTSNGIIYCDNHCESFPDDIRFGTTNDPSTADQLAQWIEESDATSATIWIKCPSNGANIFYMFVGNSSASQYSSGDDTFPLFFDDFEQDTVGSTPSKWSTGTDYNGTVTVQNNPSGDGKVMRIDDSSSGYTWAYKTISTTMTFRWFLKWYVTTDRDNYIVTEIDGGTSRGLQSKYEDSIDKMQAYNGSSYQTYDYADTFTRNTWHTLEFDFISSTQHKLYLDGDYQGAEYFWNNPSTGHSKIKLMVPNNSGFTYYDNVFLAKYASTPPTWSSFGTWTEIGGGEAETIERALDSDQAYGNEAYLASSNYGNELYIPTINA